MNTLATHILNGKKYLKRRNTDAGQSYTWTNYTISYENGKWIGQDDFDDFSNFSDITKIDTEKIKRILFIRISNFYENNNLKGDAVFVFYDNQPKDEYNSIHTVRFIHTLRKEINNYFEKRYRNDSFRNWVEERKIHEDMLSTEHHHKHQMKDLYECAIGKLNQRKLKFHYDTIYDIKTIRDFMKSGDLSILEDMTDIQVKSQIDEYCEFMLEPQVKSAVKNSIENTLTIHFSEMIFRQIMCEYLENINESIRLFTGTLGVERNIVIDAKVEDNDIIFTIENNFLMDREDLQIMSSINELGFSNQNSFGGLTTNKKLLNKIGSEQLCVKMEKTEIDGIGKFIVIFKIKNINENESN